MTTVAATVTAITDEGVVVLADSLDQAHSYGPMETLISGLTVGSRVLIEDRDDVPGTWVVAGEFANLPTQGQPDTAPRSSTMGIRWKVRKRTSDTFTARWAVALPSSHPVSDTFSLRWAIKRRISQTIDVRFRVLGNATNLGWDLRAYMRQPGGQKILLAPGNYHAGHMPRLAGSAYEHPRNGALPFNGKLRIGAQIPGTVKVYLDPTGGGRFAFTDPDNGGALGWGWDDYYDDAGWGELGISFEDIDFINGRTNLTATSGVDFINCTWTFPPEVYKAQFDQVCQLMGVPVVAQVPDTPQYDAVFDSPRNKGNGTPSGLRLQTLATFNPWLNQPVPHGGARSQRIRTINCDAFGTYDDPLFLGGCSHIKTRGYRCWSIGETTYYGALFRRRIHPDGVQFIGAEDDVDMEASEIHAHLEIVAETPGSIARLRFVRTRNLHSVIGSVGAFPFRDLAGVIDEFTWGDMNVDDADAGNYDYAESRPWYPMPGTGDYNPITLSYTYPPDGFHMKHLSGAALAALGYTMTNRRNGPSLANPAQAYNDPNNYAMQWRAAHPTSTEAGKQAAIDAVGGWAWNPS